MHDTRAWKDLLRVPVVCAWRKHSPPPPHTHTHKLYLIYVFYPPATTATFSLSDGDASTAGALPLFDTCLCSPAATTVSRHLNEAAATGVLCILTTYPHAEVCMSPAHGQGC